MQEWSVRFPENTSYIFFILFGLVNLNAAYQNIQVGDGLIRMALEAMRVNFGYVKHASSFLCSKRAIENPVPLNCRNNGPPLSHKYILYNKIYLWVN